MILLVCVPVCVCVCRMESGVWYICQCSCLPIAPFFFFFYLILISEIALYITLLFSLFCSGVQFNASSGPLCLPEYWPPLLPCNVCNPSQAWGKHLLYMQNCDGSSVVSAFCWVCNFEGTATVSARYFYNMQSKLHNITSSNSCAVSLLFLPRHIDILTRTHPNTPQGGMW